MYRSFIEANKEAERLMSTDKVHKATVVHRKSGYDVVVEQTMGEKATRVVPETGETIK